MGPYYLITTTMPPKVLVLLVVLVASMVLNTAHVAETPARDLAKLAHVGVTLVVTAAI